MASNPSFLNNLIQRRVPHIVGMYVAAAWLIIELGDWVTGRFSLPADLTSYVFVAMVAMLPAVILVAYNHGTPGKDEWTRGERVFIPLNAIAALGALYFASPALVVEAATETVAIADETGAIREFDVARQGHHRELLAFFWDNDSGDASLDWLTYGLPLMLAHDMNRVSPALSVKTPFDSRSVRVELRERGFEALTDEPQGLRIQIARERRNAAIIVGSFDKSDGSTTVTAELFDAESSTSLGTHVATAPDWFAALDELSAEILAELDVAPSDNRSDDAISQHFSDSLDAVRYFTAGELALNLDNDYPAGIAAFANAVELDPTFAEASGALSMAQYFSGDTDSARTSAQRALNNDYRLSQTSRFVLKGNSYVFEGDYGRAGRVIDMWTQLEPNSAEAFEVQARISLLRGNDEGFEKADRAYDRLLELNPNDHELYLRKAGLEQQRGDLDAAVAYLTEFLDNEPDSSDALVQLANVHQHQGDLDAAQRALEDAAILSDDPLESEIGLALLEARRGLFEDADDRLVDLLVDGQSDEQRVQILGARADVALAVGRVDDALVLFVEVNEIAKALMPPMVRLVALETQIAGFQNLLGRTDEALAIADSIMEQVQPPMDLSVHFTYTSIYEVADDREAYRLWASKTEERREQMPSIMSPFLEMQSARLALWDGDPERATLHVDRASSELGQSLIQVRDNLSVSTLVVTLANLYLEAGEIEKCDALLDEIETVFPANAHAKMVRAKARLTEGDDETARALLGETLEIWANGDTEYIFRAQATELLATL